jgi:dimethylglycine dehydrogenase
VEQKDVWSFRRAGWFEHVGNECRHVHEHVGIQDMSAFAKCRVSGPGAAAFLDRFVANKLPVRDGRMSLSHALNTRGGVHSEFTIVRESAESYYLVSAGALQRLDHDYLLKHMPRDGSVQFQDLTSAMGVLVIAGPKSRELLARVSRDDFSNAAFPWLSARPVVVGMAPCLAARVNFVGELGWELHHPMEYQNHIFDTLMAAGADIPLKPFGIRAMNSLRLEKSYRLIGTELSIEYSADESGLQRFVHADKGEFLGRDGLLAWRERGAAWQFSTLEVHDVTDADALGNNPILLDGQTVGRATGGGYGFRIGKSIALAMIAPEHAAVGTELEIEILGTRHRATVLPESPFDGANARLRA